MRQDREHTVGKKELREGWEANLSENIDEILNQKEVTLVEENAYHAQRGGSLLQLGG